MHLCVIAGHSEYLYIHVTNREGETGPSNHILDVRVMACWQPKTRRSVHAKLRFEVRNV